MLNQEFMPKQIQPFLNSKKELSEFKFNELFSESGCVVINLVGRCESNEYNGLITPQILIENYDIVNRQKYYF